MPYWGSNIFSSCGACVLEISDLLIAVNVNSISENFL